MMCAPETEMEARDDGWDIGHEVDEPAEDDKIDEAERRVEEEMEEDDGDRQQTAL